MSKLQELRKKKRLSQRQLSDLTGEKITKIQQYESGYRSIDGAKLSALLNFSSVLGCYISELLEDPDLVELTQEYEKILILDAMKKDIRKNALNKNKNK